MIKTTLFLTALAVLLASAAGNPSLSSDFQSGMVQVSAPWKLGANTTSFTGYVFNSLSSMTSLYIVNASTMNIYVHNDYKNEVQYLYSELSSGDNWCHKKPLPSGSKPIVFDWLAQASYKGQQVVHTQLVDEWGVLTSDAAANLYLQGNTPVRMTAQIDVPSWQTLVMDFYAFSTKPINPSIFTIPPWCNTARVQSMSTSPADTLSSADAAKIEAFALQHLAVSTVQDTLATAQ